jgi:hypothetical protein
MATRLVTIATFDLPPKAELARNALTAAGIQSVLGDDNLIGMDWLVGNAVGWVKLQVREEDADKAVAVLDEALGAGSEVDEEDVAAEAEETAPVEEESALEERARLAVAPTTSDENPYAPTPGSREDYARRLFVTAWLGLMMPPVWCYALYLFLNAAFKEGTLSQRGRLNLTVGAIVLLAGLPLTYILLSVLGYTVFQ